MCDERRGLGDFCQVGARICNGLGIMRACLETQKLGELGVRMDEISKRVGTGRYAGPLLTIDHNDHETHSRSH